MLLDKIATFHPAMLNDIKATVGKHTQIGLKNPERESYQVFLLAPAEISAAVIFRKKTFQAGYFKFQLLALLFQLCLH